MPVPPEAKLEVFQSPEAQATFDAGEGGPLATTPAMANGVWGPPIGMWRAAQMMPYLNEVCSLPLLAFVSAKCFCQVNRKCATGKEHAASSSISKQDNNKVARKLLHGLLGVAPSCSNPLRVLSPTPALR
jgi:hypothetical protein